MHELYFLWVKLVPVDRQCLGFKLRNERLALSVDVGGQDGEGSTERGPMRKCRRRYPVVVQIDGHILRAQDAKCLRRVEARAA